MYWAFSVNVLGFLEKRHLGSTPYETRNLAFGRAMGAPMEKFKSVVAGRAVGPHFRLLTLLNFSLEAPMSKSLGEIWAIPGRGKKILQEKIRCLIVRF